VRREPLGGHEPQTFERGASAPVASLTRNLEPRLGKASGVRRRLVRSGKGNVTVEESNSIDVVAYDPETEEALLVMVEYREWSKGPGLLEDLRGKLDCYLAYALDGQMLSDYPNLVGKLVHIQLRTRYPPGERELAFLRGVASQHLRPAGIKLSWKVLGKKGQHEL